MTINIFQKTLQQHSTKSNNNEARFNPILLFIIPRRELSLSGRKMQYDNTSNLADILILIIQRALYFSFYHISLCM